MPEGVEHLSARPAILVIAPCAIMAGAEGRDAIEARGEANEEEMPVHLSRWAKIIGIAVETLPTSRR